MRRGLREWRVLMRTFELFNASGSTTARSLRVRGGGILQEPVRPVGGVELEVEKAFDHVVSGHGAVHIDERLTERVGCGVRSHLAESGQGKAHDGAVPRELNAGLLHGKLTGFEVGAEVIGEGPDGEGLEEGVESHGQSWTLGRNTSANMQRTDPPPSFSMVGMGAWTNRAQEASLARWASVKLA